MRLKTAFLSFALAASLVASALAVSAFANGRERLTLDLFLDWEYVTQPQISPDGNQIIYARRWTDKINDKYESDIWIMSSDGSKARLLMKGSSPQWSPDGSRIAYVAQGQPAGSQLFVKWMDTGEETQLTRLERAPGNLKWSPDGKRLAFTMTVPARSEFTVKIPSRPAGAKWVEAPRVIDDLNYRADGSGYRPEGYTQIFVIPDTGGTPRQLTEGDYNHGAPQWTNDSRSIIFSAIRKPDAEYLRGDSEIYSLSLGDNQIRQLTDRRGQDANPTLSPDGRLIAYTGSDLSDDTYTVSKLYVMSVDGAGKRMLAEGFDRAPTQLIWAKDGSGIYFTTEDRGTNNVYVAPVAGGAPTQLTKGNHQIALSSIASNGLAAATLSAPHEPGDVVVFNLKQPVIKRLTDVNGDLLEGRRLGEVEEIWYDSVGGKKIQGWLIKPPDFDPAKKYPMILYIHGGPHSMYGVGFNFEFQNHAAEGYLVLYTNPRGSTGYGQEFGNAIKNNYPGDDYHDLMNGVDAVVKKGYADEQNLFVCGGSGGGVLTTWIVGHTNRFRAAVAMKPVTNWYSFVGTTDGANWYYNFKRLPWEDPEEHLRRSPITHVGKVTTPTMLMTGELDLRTPMEQTEQYYRALKLRKIDTVMVRIPDEYHPFNHMPRHPSNKLQQVAYLRGWFEKYRKK
ncbi:MAG TPA: S9 family peptidase [Blastocatellia bacterium]|jgi:dipeptidyl aminopeptidase/acylaminoacyl peptidase